MLSDTFSYIEQAYLNLPVAVTAVKNMYHLHRSDKYLHWKIVFSKCSEVIATIIKVLLEAFVGSHFITDLVSGSCLPVMLPVYVLYKKSVAKYTGNIGCTTSNTS